MQALRPSVKTHQGSIWHMTFFLLGSFFLISTCRSCHYLSLDWFPSLPLLALGYVYVGKGRTTICLELNHISVSFAFPRQLFGQMESINGTGACRRQEMLTQGPAPDPKCKLNISSFLTLPHLLNSLSHAKDIWGDQIY